MFEDLQYSEEELVRNHDGGLSSFEDLQYFKEEIEEQS